jgi:hypothetical protein
MPQRYPATLLKQVRKHVAAGQTGGASDKCSTWVRLEERFKKVVRILHGVRSLHRILQRSFELRQRPKHFIKIDG